MWLKQKHLGLQLVSAKGKEIPVIGYTILTVCLAELYIFLQRHNLVLDFTTSPVSITSKQVSCYVNAVFPNVEAIVECKCSQGVVNGE